MLAVIVVGLVGGLVTGVSPCVLPMIPIIFVTGGSGGSTARDDREDRSRPWRPALIIVGIVVSFSLITLLGTLTLAALGLPSDLLKWTGIVLLGVIGIGMLVPAVSHVLERPFARIPGWTPSGRRRGALGAFLLGIGLGTLYVPCAGPVLAAIVVAGATGDIGWRTVVLTVSFAIGAALPLAFFAVAGASMAARLAAYRSRQRAFRAVGGVVLIGLAVALVFDAPTRLQEAIPSYTASIDRALSRSDAVNHALGRSIGGAAACSGGDGLAECGAAPDFAGGGRWFNTGGARPAIDDLRGRVVLVDFWTYSCINCLRDGPHVRAWWDAYRSAGLEVVGVHTPEFAFEKDGGNVASAIADERIGYPVVQDNDYDIWNSYGNRYWPAKYLVDATGQVRATGFGEGGYAEMESRIRTLLRAANPSVVLPAPVSGADDAPATTGRTSPEMYLNPSRAGDAYSGSGALAAGVGDFTFADRQAPDTYGLTGRFDVTDEAVRALGTGRVRVNSTASTVNAVLGGAGKVTVHVDGEPDRTVTVSGPPRLYELVDGGYRERVATLTVPAGISVYTFTFG